MNLIKIGHCFRSQQTYFIRDFTSIIMGPGIRKDKAITNSAALR